MKVFFVMGGVLLLLTGTVQIAFRPRVARETAMARWLNAATIRALVFALVGLLAILLGAGVVPFPGLPSAPGAGGP